MTKKLLFALLLTSLTGAGQAQPAPYAGGDYFHALGVVVGKMRGVRYTVDICAEAFPATKAANEQAHAAWRARYHVFLDDVDRRFNGLPARWAKMDTASAQAGPANWKRLNDELDRIRGQLKQQYMTELGPDKLGQFCAVWPQVLQAPEMDFEHANAAQAALIKAGPP